MGNATQPNVNTNSLPNHHTVPPLDKIELVSSTLVLLLAPVPPLMPKLVPKHLPQLTLAKDPSHKVMVDLPPMVSSKQEIAHLTLEGRHFKPTPLEAHHPVFGPTRLENPSPTSKDGIMLKQKEEAAPQELEEPYEDDEIILARRSSKHDQLVSENTITLGTRDDCIVQVATMKEAPMGPRSSNVEAIAQLILR